MTGFVKTDVSSYTFNGTSLTAVTDGDYPALTVPGVAYLNGRVYVMEPDGTISHSDEDDFTSWDALNFVTAGFEPDRGICLARLTEYIVAYGEYTTEFFFDAQNPTGAVISVVPNATLMIGAVSGTSVQQIEGGLIWLAQQRGLGGSIMLKKFVAVLRGTQYEKVSTEDIDRILVNNDTSVVSSGLVTKDGHEFYILTLVVAGITLTFDLQSGTWAQWTKSVTTSAKTVASLTQSNGLATGVVSAGHGFSDGDPVRVSGATPSAYNVLENVTVPNATSFTYPVNATISTVASGSITAQGWSAAAFDVVASCRFGEYQLLQSRADGVIYYIDLSNTSDDGAPIDSLIRTPIFDGGSNARKRQADCALIGDQVSSQALIRWSDDDYRSFGSYKRVYLHTDRPHTTRGGEFKRRSYDIRHTSSAQARFTELEIDFAG